MKIALKSFCLHFSMCSCNIKEDIFFSDIYLTFSLSFDTSKMRKKKEAENTETNTK